MAERCTTKEQYEAWLAKQAKMMKAMDKDLLYQKPKGLLNALTAKLEQKQLLWFSDKTQLCKTHKVLHPGLIHSLTMLVAKEVTVYVDRYRYLRRKDRMEDWLVRWLERIDTISMLWMGQEAWEEAFDTCLPHGTEPHYAVNVQCDACKLACIGGDMIALQDIRTSLVARTHYFRERHNDPYWIGPFLYGVIQTWISTCYMQKDREAIIWNSDYLVPFLLDLRRKLRVQLDAEKASGKYPNRKFRKHVPKVTASGLPLPRPKYTDEETKRAKEEVLARGVYRQLHVNNDERDDSEPESTDSPDELHALNQRKNATPQNVAPQSAAPQASRTRVHRYPDQHPAASSVYSEPPHYVRPPVAPVTNPHPVFEEDEDDQENFSYELPRIAPLWEYMKCRNMASTDPKAVAPASSVKLHSWEKEYVDFIQNGGCGDDYYETVASGLSYDADDDSESSSARKEAPTFTHDNQSYQPIRGSWNPEQPGMRLETPGTPIRNSAVPEPLSTGKSSKESGQSSDPKSRTSSNTTTPSHGSSQGDGQVPNPGGRLYRERPLLSVSSEEGFGGRFRKDRPLSVKSKDGSKASVGSFERTERRAPTPYHQPEAEQYTPSQLRKGKYVVRDPQPETEQHTSSQLRKSKSVLRDRHAYAPSQPEAEQYTPSQLRKGKYVVRDHDDGPKLPQPISSTLQEDFETLNRLEGRSSKPLVRSNARRVRVHRPDSCAEVRSMQATVEDVADDVSELTGDVKRLNVDKGVQKEKSEESMASCYPTMGWGGPRKR